MAMSFHKAQKAMTEIDGGIRTKRWTEYMQKGNLEMYSDEQYRKALEVYEEKKSATETVTILEYPECRQTLYTRIQLKRILPEEKSAFQGYNMEKQPRHPSLGQKLHIHHRCLELGEVVNIRICPCDYLSCLFWT